MTRDEMVFLLRQHLSDEQAVGWPNDSELLAFLDRAADYLSEKQIADRDPGMMKSLAIAGPTPLPDDFVSFVGRVPVRIVGRQCEGPIGEALYWSRLLYPSKIAGEEALPYTREQALLIVGIAVVFAQNKNEFDVSQDMGLLGETGKLMSATRGGR